MLNPRDRQFRRRVVRPPSFRQRFDHEFRAFRAVFVIVASALAVCGDWPPGTFVAFQGLLLLYAAGALFALIGGDALD